MSVPNPAEPETKGLAEVIADLPPGREYRVRQIIALVTDQRGAPTPNRQFHYPVVKLYCPNAHCSDQRFFDPTPRQEVFMPSARPLQYDFRVDYTCRHCKSTYRHYALLVRLVKKDDLDALVTKMGEVPPFGPHTPPRLLKLLGSDGELFLKGRRAEVLGLGIGAAAYYRRVVENQKNRLLDELIKASTRIGASKEILEGLERAKSDFQFSKAIDSFKPAVPDALLLRGHNPLTLLHSALSGGIHVESDEECLEFAQIVRTILSELAERMAIALADQKELDHALSRLVDKSSGKKG